MVGSSPGAYRPGTNRKIAHLGGTKKLGSVECAHVDWKKLFPPQSSSYSQEISGEWPFRNILIFAPFCMFKRVFYLSLRSFWVKVSMPCADLWSLAQSHLNGFSEAELFFVKAHVFTFHKLILKYMCIQEQSYLYGRLACCVLTWLKCQGSSFF